MTTIREQEKGPGRKTRGSMPFPDVRPKCTESSQPWKPFTAYRGLKTTQHLRKSTAQNQIDAKCPRSRILNDRVAGAIGTTEATGNTC